MAEALSNGTRIYFEEQGSGDALLLIPGLGATAAVWGGVVGRFAATHRVVTMEPRGSGRSDTPDEVYTGRCVTEDVAAVLDAAGIDDAHVVGMSMGGMIAQEFAIRHPDRVRSLVLAATYASPDAWTSRVFEVRRRVLETSGLADQLRMSTLFLLSRESFRERMPLVELFEATVADAPPDEQAYKRQMDFCTRHDTRERLVTVTAPTLVVAGSEDMLVPPGQSEELARCIDGAVYEEIAGGSHGFVAESAGVFSDILATFLSGLTNEITQA